MKSRIQIMLAASGIALISSGAVAQTAPEQSADPATEAYSRTEANEAEGSEDIVVTARRRAESLQDVPQTVNAVTNETIEKLNIQNFQDIQSVVPGLTLEAAGNGFSTTASVRGATFNVETGAKETVVMYQN